MKDANCNQCGKPIKLCGEVPTELQVCYDCLMCPPKTPGSLQLCDWPGCIRGHLYYQTETNVYACQAHGAFLVDEDWTHLFQQANPALDMTEERRQEIRRVIEQTKADRAYALRIGQIRTLLNTPPYEPDYEI